jgi:hypothetical protein
MTASIDAVEGPPSPYVGPRAFRQGERFYGRERQATGLVNTLIAGRIVLLHAPSGAGKTSLIQAAVAPAMVDRDFQLCVRTTPRFSALRVNLPEPPNFEVKNRYVFSVLCGLLGEIVEDIEQLRDWTIEDGLSELGSRCEPDTRQLLIFDQFEEILTLDPTDQSGQREFFEQVGDALDQSGRWALFAMREDYMGGLDRYLRYIPGQFRSTFRLDLLEADAARRAIQLPARESGVDFHDDAAQRLVADLRKVRVESPDSGVKVIDGNFVEPVLLQVVCDNLWQAVTGPELRTISEHDVDQFAQLDNALARYYSLAVRYAAGKGQATERTIRDWVEEKLLTEQQFRGQTRMLPKVDDVEDVMRRMQRRYLVRDDPRPNATWWELSHDRLIDPVLESNRQWRTEHLEWWQIDARRWRMSGERDEHLLTVEQLRHVNGSRRRLEVEETEAETDFLARSRKVAAEEGRLRLLRAQMGRLSVALVLSVLVNVALLIYLLRS